jgi:hypothetical protein
MLLKHFLHLKSNTRLVQELAAKLNESPAA